MCQKWRALERCAPPPRPRGARDQPYRARRHSHLPAPSRRAQLPQRLLSAARLHSRWELLLQCHWPMSPGSWQLVDETSRQHITAPGGAAKSAGLNERGDVARTGLDAAAASSHRLPASSSHRLHAEGDDTSRQRLGDATTAASAPACDGSHDAECVAAHTEPPEAARPRDVASSSHRHQHGHDYSSWQRPLMGMCICMA